MSIKAGRLRERVAIQSKNLVDNGRGGRARPAGGPEWIDDATSVAAEVIPLRGDEALQHAVLRSVQLYRVTIRARAGVSAAQRLLWRGTPLNIKALAHSTDRRDIVMTCEAGNVG
jgi:SPP1 family predicted phage head-tail adaptor